MTQSTSLNDLYKATTGHWERYHTQLKALEVPRGDVLDVDAYDAYVQAVDKIVQRGMRSLKKVQKALALWKESMNMDGEALMDEALTDKETVLRLIQRLQLSTTQRSVDNLADLFKIARESAALFREDGALRRSYRVPFSPIRLPAYAENEKSPSTPTVPLPSLEADDRSDLQTLADKLLELRASQNSFDEFQVEALPQQMEEVRRKIRYYRAKYREDPVIDWERARACLAVIQPLRRTLAIQQERLLDARKAMRKHQIEQEAKKSRMAATFKRVKHVPRGWHVLLSSEN